MSKPGIENGVQKRYYLSNRDLLVIAILSGIGGVLSTYVGYLGNLLNRIFGVPFGAGQFVAGLHVFWIILVAGLVRKPGAATAAGLLKGVVEMLTGSTHGIVIVLVSLVQGLVVDLVLWIMRRHTLASYNIAGGLATASNVFVFQILFFSGVPIGYILFIGGLAFISGCLLAGSFGKSVLDLIDTAGVLRLRSAADAPDERLAETGKPARPAWLKLIITGILVAAFSVGAVYYYAAVFDPPWAGPQCQVEGLVENECSISLSQLKEHETTIRAELKGQVTHVPPQDYTGIPVKEILKEARPLPEAAEVKVIATDGYEVAFKLDDVMADDMMILIQEEDMLRLIAGNYEGGYWVKQVSRIKVE
ncbi:MAG TPA: molybdopterin-dependent oxidoreductase [Syntrophomonadaceae bacterium]|nr:molybdopterin-dependent oxidoreductase [Syntrophomonadaceae bacterium]